MMSFLSHVVTGTGRIRLKQSNMLNSYACMCSDVAGGGGGSATALGGGILSDG
jgi:hypothetical protein